VRGRNPRLYSHRGPKLTGGARFFCLLPSHSTQRELSSPSDHPLQPLTKPPLQRPSELYIYIYIVYIFRYLGGIAALGAVTCLFKTLGVWGLRARALGLRDCEWGPPAGSQVQKAYLCGISFRAGGNRVINHG